jgi:hypothetical protein
MSKVQCFECHEYGHYKRNCPKLTKKRKERHHASAANDEEPSKKTKHDETNLFQVDIGGHPHFPNGSKQWPSIYYF